MTEQRSYTHIEHQLAPHFRERMNQAESDQDVSKFFVQTVQQLIERATDGAVLPAYEDIALDPEADPPWRIDARLRDDAALARALAGSDLPAILGRFATSAAHHLRRERRNHQRTEAKIIHEDPRGPQGRR